MNLFGLYDKLVQFEEAPTQAGIAILRSEINTALFKGDITEEDKDDLLKKLYSIATEAGLFVLQLRNIEAKEEVEIEEEDEYEESYEESYSYSYDEEDDSDDEN